MFEILKSPDCARVISLDQSTSCTGVSVFDVNLMKPAPIKLQYMNTIFGDKLLYDIPVQYDDLSSTKVLARSWAMARSINMLIQVFEPDMGIGEDNFLGPSPETFKNLIKLTEILRSPFVENDVHFSFVLPRLAKAVVGADFKGSTKDDVRIGLMNYPHLDSNGIDLSIVDEHSSDSGAIGLWRCEKLARDHGVFIGDQSFAK